MNNLRVKARHKTVLGIEGNLPNEGDVYLLRVIKLIPSEALVLYLVGENIIPPDQKLGMIVFSIVCLLFAFLSRSRLTKDKNHTSPQWQSVIISSISFIIWVYASGGIFASFGLYQQWVATLTLITWVFFIPYLYKGEPQDE